MTEVLFRELTLTPENEKTNVPLKFTVPEGAEKLRISYSYHPKTMGDCERAKALIEENLRKDTHGDRELYPDYTDFLPLNNLVTLSLDDPDSYRGAAHRQDSVQLHEITREKASVGFIKGDIGKGEWTLTLNVHALVTEECYCSVRVETGGARDE